MRHRVASSQPVSLLVRLHPGVGEHRAGDGLLRPAQRHGLPAGGVRVQFDLIMLTDTVAARLQATNPFLQAVQAFLAAGSDQAVSQMLESRLEAGDEAGVDGVFLLFPSRGVAIEVHLLAVLTEDALHADGVAAGRFDRHGPFGSNGRWPPRLTTR